MEGKRRRKCRSLLGVMGSKPSTQILRS